MKLFLSKLKFPDPAIEALFIEDYFEKSIFTVRIALILGIILYSAFGVLDSLIAPLTKSKIWFIRFAIVVPSLFVVFGVSYLNIFKKYMQIILSALSLIAGFGIVAMIGIAVEKESGLFYYAGLMLVLMWSYTFVKLRFTYAAASGWIIVFAYEITAVFFQGMLENSRLVSIFINNNFFFISSNIIGMFACYLIEHYTRKNFIQRRELADKREELQNERNQLKDRINIMNKELEMARVIQQNFIPRKSPNHYIHSFYKPMEAVGGDLLDFIEFKDKNKVGIFLSDVSGHGVPAALITSMIKSSILESRKISSNPAILLHHLNQVLKIQTNDNYVTAFYGIYDNISHSLIYSNAGHLPPSIILKDKIVKLNTAKSIPLSVMNSQDLTQSGLDYTNSKAVLPGNSKLLLFTDGLVEARNNHDPKLEFGNEIDDHFLKLKDLDSKDFINTLYNELILFHGNDLFNDDICIICIDIA